MHPRDIHPNKRCTDTPILGVHIRTLCDTHTPSVGVQTCPNSRCIYPTLCYTLPLQLEQRHTQIPSAYMHPSLHIHTSEGVQTCPNSSLRACTLPYTPKMRYVCRRTTIPAADVTDNRRLIKILGKQLKHDPVHMLSKSS